MPFQIILLKVHYASDIVFCGSITLIRIYTHREICTHYRLGCVTGYQVIRVIRIFAKTYPFE